MQKTDDRVKNVMSCGAPDLCVVVEIPEVQTTIAIHCSKERWMHWRPHDIINIVCIVFKGIQGLVMLSERWNSYVMLHDQNTYRARHKFQNNSYLGWPQFDRPVKWGSGKEVGEVDWTHSVMAADSSHRTLMPIKHFTNTSLTAWDELSRFKLIVKLFFIKSF